MPTRREFLSGAVGAMVGVVAWEGYQGNIKQEQIEKVTDGAMPTQLKTEEKIKTVESGRGEVFKRLELFKSGAAKLYLSEDHAWGRVGFTHANHDVSQQRYQTWDAPEFSGPLVVDVKAVIQNNGPYPSRGFRFGGLAEEDQVMIVPYRHLDFKAPRSYLP